MIKYSYGFPPIQVPDSNRAVLKPPGVKLQTDVLVQKNNENIARKIDRRGSVINISVLK